MEDMGRHFIDEIGCNKNSIIEVMVDRGDLGVISDKESSGNTV